MLVVKVGGPAYRIGLGGGAASSRMQDASQAALDFDAVQRGDAEMENKMNRVIRAAIERRGENPIVSIHDQGAGGNGNVLKAISAPNGAEIDIRNMEVGDPTMSVKELWGAEFQENDAMLIREKDRAFLEAVGERENVPVMVMGKMRDTGRMVVKDSKTGETVEVARKVTFNPAIRARTVTVEGDVFEPSDIVEGGSRRRGAPVLSLLSKANRVRGELDAKERELDASSRELSEMRKRAEKYRSAKSALELALHNLEVLEKAEGVAEEALVREVREEYEKVKREASEKKEETRRQSEELRGLEKALEVCANERVRVEGVLKQNGVKKAKLEKARSESVE